MQIVIYLKEIVDFKREDIYRLVFAFDAQRRWIFRRTLLGHDGVPFLDKESRRDGVDGNRDGT